MSSNQIDKRNAEFWNELCGSAFARSLGIHDLSPESLRRFDEAYLRFYPYLGQYVFSEHLKGKMVLEIGLGYGTLGQLLVSEGCRYHGLDIAENPVAVMQYRLAHCGLDRYPTVQIGSALQIPYRDSSFDYVYSIGCLHHVGNLSKAVSEVYRVLATGGKAIIMLYNRYSFRRIVKLPSVRLRDLIVRSFKAQSGQANFSQRVRAFYDKNFNGEPAPHTDFVSRKEARALFREYRKVRIESQNFDPIVLLKDRLVVPRESLLSNVGRAFGSDLYITASK